MNKQQQDDTHVGAPYAGRYAGSAIEFPHRTTVGQPSNHAKKYAAQPEPSHRQGHSFGIHPADNPYDSDSFDVEGADYPDEPVRSRSSAIRYSTAPSRRETVRLQPRPTKVIRHRRVDRATLVIWLSLALIVMVGGWWLLSAGKLVVRDTGQLEVRHPAHVPGRPVRRPGGQSQPSRSLYRPQSARRDRGRTDQSARPFQRHRIRVDQRGERECPRQPELSGCERGWEDGYCGYDWRHYPLQRHHAQQRQDISTDPISTLAQASGSHASPALHIKERENHADER